MAEFAQTRAVLDKSCYCFGGMDARAVARAAGVSLGRLNVWVQRGLPGVLEPGVRGRRRDIDAQTALKIAIFAQIVGFGVQTSDAAGVVQAIAALDFEARFVVVPPPHEEVIIPPDYARPPGSIRQEGDRTLTMTEPAPDPRWPPQTEAIEWRVAVGPDAPDPATWTDEMRRDFARKIKESMEAQRMRCRVVFSDAELARVFDDVEQRPGSYLIIDIAVLAQRVRQAAEEWNRRREGKD